MREQMLGQVKQTNANLTEILARNTFLATETATVQKSNRDNLSKLIDIQEKTGEACFFVGLYSLSTSLLPEKPLLDANEYLSFIKSEYSRLLDGNSLNIKYSNIDSALKIYGEWGLKLKCLSMNKVGESILGKHLKDKTISTCLNRTWESLDTNQTPVPYSILLHQPGGNDSHFLTINGTQETDDLRKKYIDKNYKTIAIFEFHQDIALGRDTSLR